MIIKYYHNTGFGDNTLFIIYESKSENIFTISNEGFCKNISEHWLFEDLEYCVKTNYFRKEYLNELEENVFLKNLNKIKIKQLMTQMRYDV